MKRLTMKLYAFAALIVLLAAPGVIHAQNVKVTSIGQRTGDFCFRDRALMFEDPTGFRILYDPGFTISGATDTRLGLVHVVLLSHAHGDHIGASRLNQDPDAPTATCNIPPVLAATPNSQTAEIAAAKNSAVIVGANLAGFLNLRMGTILGATVPGCVPAGVAVSEVIVPRSSPCTQGMGISGKVTVTASAGRAGVRIAVVPAVHDSSLPAAMMTAAEQSNTRLARLTNYVDPANGYVLTFSNGLTVYLSGDTGAFGDMKTTVNEFYGAKLAVVNIGDINTMGPEEAADAVNRLIKPKAVIASHSNEVSTTNGDVNPNTKTSQFLGLLRDVAGYVPLSGRTMEFDGSGNCAAGCPEIVPVTGLTLTPSTVPAGGSLTATVSGTGLDSQTYFDIRFRAPGSTTEELVYNWQQGTSSSHTVAADAARGTYTITGVRAHRDPTVHAGTFSAVTVTLVVN